MSKEVFESIKAGLEDAIAYAKGDKTRGTVRYSKSNPIKLSKEKPTKKRKKK